MPPPKTRRGGPGQAASEVAYTTDDVAMLAQPSLDDALRNLSGRDRAEAGMDDWWASIAMQAVRAEAATGRVFQAYDIVERYGLVEPDDPNRWGALFTRARRLGIITAVGVAPSRRPETARSLVRVWRGV